LKEVKKVTNPVIVLGEILGIPPEEIEEHLNPEYRVVRVPKRKGKGFRIFYIPNEKLKEIQRKILKVFFLFKSELHSIHSGILKGTSYLGHAQQHLRGRWFFQVDLKDAFPSVEIEKLRNILLKYLKLRENGWRNRLELLISSLGEVEVTIKTMEEKDGSGWKVENKLIVILDYLSFLSPFLILKKLKQKTLLELKTIRKVGKADRYILANISSLDKEGLLKEINQAKEKIEKALSLFPIPMEEIKDLIINLCTYQERILPQGTPTAPIFFLLYLKESGLVREILDYLNEKVTIPWWNISWYVDNLVISTDPNPLSQEVREKIIQLIKKAGFEISRCANRDIRHGSPTITGLRIGEKGERILTLPKRERRKWRAIFHKAVQIRDPELVKKVEGFIASLQQVYPYTWPSELKPFFGLLKA
jgi:hypothetical protein